MGLQNTTRNINQSLLRIENFYFNNETNYNIKVLKERWSLYNEIFNQLTLLNKGDAFHQIEYRILDGGNINDILKSIINSDDEIYLLLYPFIYVLEEYYDFDGISAFL